MTAIYDYKGDILDFTPTTDMEAGDVGFIGSIAGVASHPIAANELGALGVQGVYKVKTGSTTAFTLGAKVYYNTTSKLATASTSDKLLGTAVKACVAGDEVVAVLFNVE